MQRYFCLPPVWSHERPELLHKYDPGVKVFPCLLTLPMGFSHAVYLAQAGHLRIAHTESDLSPTGMVCAGNDLSVARLRHLVYIDDFILLSTVCALVDSELN